MDPESIVLPLDDPPIFQEKTLASASCSQADAEGRKNGVLSENNNTIKNAEGSMSVRARRSWNLRPTDLARWLRYDILRGRVELTR